MNRVKRRTAAGKMIAIRGSVARRVRAQEMGAIIEPAALVRRFAERVARFGVTLR